MNNTTNSLSSLVYEDNLFQPGLVSQNRPYVAALDYLRAIAAITVVIYHVLVTYRGYKNPGAGLEQLWPHVKNPVTAFFVEGHTSVALFMVLSGYVLSLGVFKREISYRKFIINRILRIYPLYTLLLVLGVYGNPKAFTLNAFFQTLLPFANLPGTIGSGITFTALFWAVAVEFQFYLIFPFIVSFIRRYGLGYLCSLMAFIILLRILTAFGPTDMNSFSYNTIFGRIDQFLIGIFFANIAVPKCFRHHLTLPVVLLTGLLTIVGFNQLGGYPKYESWRIFWPTLEGMIWGLVITSSVHSPYNMPIIFRRLLTFVASISFSIYLLHSPILQIAGEHNLYYEPFKNPLANAFLNSMFLLPVVIIISFFSYRIIERPFLQLRYGYVTE